MILQFFPTVCRAIRDIDFYLTQRKGSYRPQGIGLGCPFRVLSLKAAEYSNIGINRIEELLKIPNCKFVLYVGKKKLVKRREFDKFLSDIVEI